jgi:hypothetical protein
MHHYLITYEITGTDTVGVYHTLVSAGSRDEAVALWEATGDEAKTLESVWQLPAVADTPRVHFWGID